MVQKSFQKIIKKCTMKVPSKLALWKSSMSQKDFHSVVWINSPIPNFYFKSALNSKQGLTVKTVLEI